MIDERTHNRNRRQAGDHGLSLFPAEAYQRTGRPPAPSTGTAELENRLCLGIRFGRSEHQARAMVGVSFVGIANRRTSMPLLRGSLSVQSISSWRRLGS